MLLSLAAQNELERGGGGIKMESCTDLQLRCFNPHSTDGRKGGGGGQGCMCVCMSAYRYNSQSAEPNVPPIKVYLDQVVTAFSGSEGRLV